MTSTARDEVDRLGPGPPASAIGRLETGRRPVVAGTAPRLFPLSSLEHSCGRGRLMMLALDSQVPAFSDAINGRVGVPDASSKRTQNLCTSHRPFQGKLSVPQALPYGQHHRGRSAAGEVKFTATSEKLGNVAIAKPPPNLATARNDSNSKGRVAGPEPAERQRRRDPLARGTYRDRMPKRAAAS
jgi:hypothetical protein